eukprot:CAMPEP_0115066290 /NCGR_PEP_ID=MMETSP0227-20121206/10730_1 /TAXON_ID=89957 /ORGANISM="Polarella glacialis, Strain CCMP 1383" /LENGTH=40 /DNA_ID= /DNA_START= /DNA_END= /DNA_ORIENTATION=
MWLTIWVTRRSKSCWSAYRLASSVALANLPDMLQGVSPLA